MTATIISAVSEGLESSYTVQVEVHQFLGCFFSPQNYLLGVFVELESMQVNFHWLGLKTSLRVILTSPWPVRKLPSSYLRCECVPLPCPNAVFVHMQATELFVRHISRQAHVFTVRGKRKTIQRRDVIACLPEKDEFAFLEGAIDWHTLQITLKITFNHSHNYWSQNCWLSNTCTFNSTWHGCYAEVREVL